MTKKEWADIKAAAALLGLGEKATLAEIKKAYRRMSKKHHPEVKESSKQKTKNIEMHKLTEAYQILMHYCTQYRFPLIQEDNEQLEGDDWWFERFGHDSHWGKERAPKEDSKE